MFHLFFFFLVYQHSFPPVPLLPPHPASPVPRRRTTDAVCMYACSVSVVYHAVRHQRKKKKRRETRHTAASKTCMHARSKPPLTRPSSPLARNQQMDALLKNNERRGLKRMRWPAKICSRLEPFLLR
ncbi:hypothetical protein QBC43DRAFT_322324 [Cladorrhinum sp. PSN259]|nr:hypothetical protein QBC43DRAFT_322324 [Cladorrhinum sp. PSN259]